LKRKTASRTLLTLLLISMLTLTFNIQSAKAEPVTILSVYPPLSTALVGENFTINVTITDVVNLYGWQVNITFNPNILNVESAVEGPFLKQVYNTFYMKIIDNSAGYVLAMSLFMPPFPPGGANGSGVLASVTFQVKVVGSTTIHFSEGTKLRTWMQGNIQPISYMAEDGFFTNLPPEIIQRLTETIETWNLANGAKNSLTSKLHAAYCSLDRKNQNASLRQLRTFINQVEALRLKKLTREQADYLITEAQRIIDLI